MVHKMEVDKSSYTELAHMLKSMGPHTEVECKLKDPIDKDAFTRMIQYCRSLNMTETIHDDQLDIFFNLPSTPSNVRLSIKGKDSISMYCKTNTLPPPESVETIIKKPIKGIKSVLLKDISFKVDMKDEVPLDDFAKQEVITRLPSLDKGYRFKKRFSYQDKQLRFDFSIVKTSLSNGANFVCHKGFVTSGTVNGTESYEVEIEFIPSKQAVVPVKRGRLPKAVAAEGTGTSDMVHVYIQAMISMYMILKDEHHYVPPSIKREALQNYINMCFGKVDKDILEKNPRTYFAAPQPVTLERKNLYTPDLGVSSILHDYTVTDKADGERALLFVNADGKCYFVDSRLNMRFTGVKLNNLVNTLLDGELITRDAKGNKIAHYGVFDIYFHNNEDVRALPLVAPKISKGGRLIKGNSRHDIIKDIEKRYGSKFEEEGNLKLFAKRFLFGGNIFDHARTILEESGILPYKIDGLIFTPANLGVSATFKDQAVNTKAMFGGTWDKVFKYKPPEENTIDFLVKFGMVNATDGKGFRELELFIGFNPQKWNRLTALEYIEGRPKQRSGYFEKRFEPSDIPEGNPSSAFVEIGADRAIRCLNGDEISNNTIVECAWITEKWVPIRVRKDKTELYKKQGISRTANDIKAAMSIWSTLRLPISYDMITGRAEVPPPVMDDLDDDVYYCRNIARDKLATKSMLDFHNYWIKNMCLIQKYKGKTLFDIACGKAGDLNKWIDAGIEKVLGIDYSRDNIENPVDGAYSRTLNRLTSLQPRRLKPHPQANSHIKFLYITMDGSKVINEEYINGLSEDDKHVARIAWGLQKPPLSERKAQEFYKYVPSHGFDMVSCQFAIHYFFENDTTLNNFVRNVNANLAHGGYFIGTCLDGNKIKATMAKAKTTELRGIKGDRTIWNITKTGDNELSIYMESIGRKMKEYFVDFDKLIDAFKRYNIVLAAPITSFETEWNKLSDDPNVDAQIKDRILNMSDVEKTYSFMNVYFVFQKASDVSKS